MDINEIISSLASLYYYYCPCMDKLSVKLILTDSLGKTNCELRPDIKNRLLEQNVINEDNSNGRMILPQNLDDDIHILLNSKKVIEYTNDGTMTWLGTFAHEMTHAIDFYQMARKENLQSYDPLQEVELYLMFQLWSEYHARKLGYGFLRKVLSVDNDELYLKRERIEHITQTEWPYHKRIHFEEYHQNTEGNHQMYITMQMLGRYSVWCELFPEIFNEQEFALDFPCDKWLYDLFVFMRKHETLNQIYNNFDNIETILKENWPI